jgi:cyclopropane fatty-acyl-phospholipid synthase-like methyltransferase
MLKIQFLAKRKNMQERHTNKQKYFLEQETTVNKYIIPFINEIINLNETISVLEIGCGEGGNLKPFLEMGCERVVGVDLSEAKIANANKFFSTQKNASNIEFIAADIYDLDNLGEFDIIITKDVLEHIHGQERFMNYVKKFLKPSGKFFLGFPPWYNPFGGHQQIAVNKYLSKIPFIHILPNSIYKLILKSFGESEATQRALLEIKQTGITIERFERILKKTNYKIDQRKFYLINPNYEIKFGLKPRKTPGIISVIPYFRDFLTTTNYYVVSKNNN